MWKAVKCKVKPLAWLLTFSLAFYISVRFTVIGMRTWVARKPKW